MSKADDGGLEVFKSLVTNAQNETADFKKFTRQIWLAGLGAYAKDDNDSSFEELVLEGKSYEKKAKDKQSSEPLPKKNATQTSGTWQRLETAFDERLSTALRRLGICTNSDIENLNNELDHLTQIILALSEQDE